MFRKTSPICQCHLHSWKKCWKVHIRVLALLIPPWIVNSKKFKNKWWQRTTSVLSACQVSLGNDIPESRGKKIIYFGVLIVFFCRGTHECYSLMKLGRHLKHLSFFATNFFYFFWTFLDFTIHGGSIRAKTRMSTFQHLFRECKWHSHIGDVFLNILVSYLHFSDLVWISYEVFKLTVKRSKGKSIIGAKWLGQNQWLLGIRGKTDEWDTTRGINLIIPLQKQERLSSYQLFSSQPVHHISSLLPFTCTTEWWIIIIVHVHWTKLESANI